MAVVVRVRLVAVPEQAREVPAVEEQAKVLAREVLVLPQRHRASRRRHRRKPPATRSKQQPPLAEALPSAWAC